MVGVFFCRLSLIVVVVVVALLTAHRSRNFFKSSFILIENPSNMPEAEGGIFSGVGILEQQQALFLVQATIILGLCRALGVFGQYLKQPPVIFEVIGEPSLLY